MSSPVPGTIYAERLARVRAELAAQGLDGFVVPISDEHMSEYVGAYAQRLAWLTGFGGRPGLRRCCREGCVFIDGRYTVQVRDQVDGSLFDYVGVPQSSVAEWLGNERQAGQKIGFDPWLHGIDWARSLGNALTAKGAELVAVDVNPLDARGTGPRPSAAVVTVHDRAGGQAAVEKREVIADWLKAHGLDTTVMTALDSVAWTFNIRGSDVSHTPVGLAFALLHADATADLFIAPEKITDAVRAHLGNACVHDRDAIRGGARRSERARRWRSIPTARSPRSSPRSKAAGAKIASLRDPAVLPKAIKNETELDGTSAAHVRDGVALSRFLQWMEDVAPRGARRTGRLRKLREFRDQDTARWSI
jgi:Xaa-Pro aminopeptidase